MVGNVVVVFGSATLGRGDDVLGAELIVKFLRMIRDNEPRPATLIFMNTGVHLSTAGSPVTEELQALEAMGVELLSCGTCLDYFNIREKIIAGRASNMGEIYGRIGNASKVIGM